MIKVNNKDIEWEMSLTAEKLLQIILTRQDILPVRGAFQTIIINGDIISPHERIATLINDGDNVSIVPLLGGG